MKIYHFGAEDAPVLLLLPGTGTSAPNTSPPSGPAASRC